jgi:D-glycero-D-manno-heptose 1,7-bisphosphate phosphatase
MRDWPPEVVPRYPTAVFLDRDGTINVDTHYPHRIADLELLPRSGEALALLAKLAVQIIVISNQAGIALGMYTREAMSAFNRELRARVEQHGGRIDAFYYCPHREPKDLGPGEVACFCSKPAPGLLVEAARDFELDLSRSFIIGDKVSDAQAGRAVQTHSILLTRDHDIEGAADAVADDLLDAIGIVERHLQRPARLRAAR